MALHLTAKAAGETRSYEWAPKLANGDSIASYVLTPATLTVSEDANEGNAITFKVAGGADGNIYAIDASCVTDEGDALTETLYVPVIDTDATIAPTGNDVCAFALRKIAGNGADADAAELADALERLNMMLAAWRKQGADVGAALPVLSATSLTIPDEFVEAIKFNLRNQLHRFYGVPLDAMDVAEASRGLQLVKAANLPSEREGADYY